MWPIFSVSNIHLSKTFQSVHLMYWGLNFWHVQYPTVFISVLEVEWRWLNYVHPVLLVHDCRWYAKAMSAALAFSNDAALDSLLVCWKVIFFQMVCLRLSQVHVTLAWLMALDQPRSHLGQVPVAMQPFVLHRIYFYCPRLHHLYLYCLHWNVQIWWNDSTIFVIQIWEFLQQVMCCNKSLLLNVWPSLWNRLINCRDLI